MGRSRLSVKNSDNLKAINLASGFNTRNNRYTPLATEIREC